MIGLKSVILMTGLASVASTGAFGQSVAPTQLSGVVGPDASQVEQEPNDPAKTPPNAPNVFLFMSDDVGFAMASTFGGPVPTPNLDRLAKGGVRFNRFHTTGICSPTRAALLTGRNHHHAEFGYLADLPDDHPGYHAEIPKKTASVAEILKLNGYNTAMFGKTHNVKPEATSAAGPFDQWPTGQGFEYFFGLVGGDTDQYRPALYRGTTRLADLPDDGPMLEKQMADDMIGWLHNQQAAAPDKPFLIYYAPGSTHAPHQAPRAYVDLFRGKFNAGWDTTRETTWRRQRAQGIIPASTTLTERPPEIPAWDSVSPKMKTFAARTMEAAAGMLAYQDVQLGRVLDELDRTSEAKNLLTIIVIGDNGASAEAGVEGTINELGKINGNRESEDWLYANIDKLGGPMTYPSYPAGWAWAMNTPLRWTKQYTSMLGGIRNGMIMRWNNQVAKLGSICPQFGHITDIAPTILDAAGISAPQMMNGVRQDAMDGKSLLASLKKCQPDAPRTQYFEIGGKIGLWHDGWWASRDDGRLPWQLKPPGDPSSQAWELYDLTRDFSQSRNVASQHPKKLAELIALWDREAKSNNVYPLNHKFGIARAAGHRPSTTTQFDYWGKEVSVQLGLAPQLVGRNFKIDVNVVSPTNEASGVLVAIGSRFAGWSLYLDRGRAVFAYAASTFPDDIVSVVATRSLQGEHLNVSFETSGARQPATVILSDAGGVLARGDIPRTFLLPAGLGETLDIGRDAGVPVVAYGVTDGAFPGEIPHVRITLAPNKHQTAH